MSLGLLIQSRQPVVGNNAAVLIVTDARTNQPIDDAVITAVPWMTMHSHGSPNKPTIKKTGDRRYRVDNLYYTMEGDWDLIVSVQKGRSRDTATFPIMNVKKK